MGKVVTVMNMKGGVGKTTVAMHLAAASVAWGFGKKAPPARVLAIDYDPQFNLSQSLLAPKNYFNIEQKGQTILSVLHEGEENLDPYHLQVPGNENPPPVADVATRIMSYRTGYLDLVPSTLDLMYVALGQAEGSLKPMENRFGKFINECKAKYDLIIIDCHPAGSVFTKTSLRNSDFVVIPVVPQKYAVRGIGLMMTFIEAKKQGAKGPEPLILFNNVPRVGVSKEETSIRAHAKYGPLCLDTSMKKYTAFTEPEHGSGFAWQSKKAYSSEATGNIYRLSREFLQKVGLMNDAQ